MTWLDTAGIERRPLVFVEDHLYHMTELLAALGRRRPDLADQVTVCALDRAGPDTDAAVADCLRRFDRVLLAAAAPIASTRVLPLTAAHTQDATSLARRIASLLRPGGLLVQDVQLSSLAFVPADRWWDSIAIAAAVRGMFGDRPPQVRFMSNKRGYAATFGRDLMECGFDPRDVMDKAEIDDTIVPTVSAAIDAAFPLRLRTRGRAWRLAAHDADRQEIEAELDIVAWRIGGTFVLGGRLLHDAALTLRPGSHEAASWWALIEDRLSDGPGLPVLDVGGRVAPAGAERAERSNVAARHVHLLRSRLRDARAILTADHAYHLREDLRVGVVNSADLQHPPVSWPPSIKVGE